MIVKANSKIPFSELIQKYYKQASISKKEKKRLKNLFLKEKNYLQKIKNF
jgi:hypothetical protein